MATTVASITFTLAVEDGYDGPALPEAQQPAQPAEPGQAQPTQPVEGEATPEGAPAEQPEPGFGALLPLIVLGVLLLMFILMTSGQRRERKKHQAMLNALQKGDRVQTVGGIIGTLVELRDNEVVLKVDENTNTRLRFARSAVKEVVESKDQSNAA